jgi:hypothetical protein
MGMFSLKTLKKVESEANYRFEVSNRFAALEDLDVEVEFYSAWEMIRENVKISARESLGYYELKKHKPWFDEECSKLLDQRKQAKLQWLQNPNDLRRGINEFKRCYQPRSNLVKNENGDLLVDLKNIVNGWKSYFSRLLNVHNVSDVRQIERHTTEQLVLCHSLEVENAIARLKRYTFPGSDQILAELI